MLLPVFNIERNIRGNHKFPEVGHIYPDSTSEQYPNIIGTKCDNWKFRCDWYATLFYERWKPCDKPGPGKQEKGYA